MQGINLVLALRGLFEQATDQPECLKNLVVQGFLGDFPQMSAQVPADPAGMALELAQGLAHAPELLGMGITSDLGGEPRGKVGVALAQFNPGLFRQACQQRPRALVKPDISWVGDVLFHHSRVDGHPFQAFVADRARGPASLDGLGRQLLR